MYPIMNHTFMHHKSLKNRNTKDLNRKSSTHSLTEQRATRIMRFESTSSSAMPQKNSLPTNTARFPSNSGCPSGFVQAHRRPPDKEQIIAHSAGTKPSHQSPCPLGTASHHENCLSLNASANGSNKSINQLLLDHGTMNSTIDIGGDRSIRNGISTNLNSKNIPNIQRTINDEQHPNEIRQGNPQQKSISHSLNMRSSFLGFRVFQHHSLSQLVAIIFIFITFPNVSAEEDALNGIYRFASNEVMDAPFTYGTGSCNSWEAIPVDVDAWESIHGSDYSWTDDGYDWRDAGYEWTNHWDHYASNAAWDDIHKSISWDYVSAVHTLPPPLDVYTEDGVTLDWRNWLGVTGGWLKSWSDSLQSFEFHFCEPVVIHQVIIIAPDGCEKAELTYKDNDGNWFEWSQDNQPFSQVQGTGHWLESETVSFGKIQNLDPVASTEWKITDVDCHGWTGGVQLTISPSPSPPAAPAPHISPLMAELWQAMCLWGSEFHQVGYRQTHQPLGAVGSVTDPCPDTLTPENTLTYTERLGPCVDGCMEYVYAAGAPPDQGAGSNMVDYWPAYTFVRCVDTTLNADTVTCTIPTSSLPKYHDRIRCPTIDYWKESTPNGLMSRKQAYEVMRTATQQQTIENINACDTPAPENCILDRYNQFEIDSTQCEDSAATELNGIYRFASNKLMDAPFTYGTDTCDSWDAIPLDVDAWETGMGSESEISWADYYDSDYFWYDYYGSGWNYEYSDPEWDEVEKTIEWRLIYDALPPPLDVYTKDGATLDWRNWLGVTGGWLHSWDNFETGEATLQSFEFHFCEPAVIHQVIIIAPYGGDPSCEGAKLEFQDNSGEWMEWTGSNQVFSKVEGTGYWLESETVLFGKIQNLDPVASKEWKVTDVDCHGWTGGIQLTISPSPSLPTAPPPPLTPLTNPLWLQAMCLWGSEFLQVGYHQEEPLGTVGSETDPCPDTLNAANTLAYTERLGPCVDGCMEFVYAAGAPPDGWTYGPWQDVWPTNQDYWPAYTFVRCVDKDLGADSGTCTMTASSLPKYHSRIWCPTIDHWEASSDDGIMSRKEAYEVMGTATQQLTNEDITACGTPAPENCILDRYNQFAIDSTQCEDSPAADTTTESPSTGSPTSSPTGSPTTGSPTTISPTNSALLRRTCCRTSVVQSTLTWPAPGTRPSLENCSGLFPWSAQWAP